MTDGGSSDTVLHKGPCPKCGSSDALVTYTDGHAHCFSMGCGYFLRSTPDLLEGRAKTPRALLTPSGGYTPLKDRGLEVKTLRSYGYFATTYSGKNVQVAPYYTMSGELCSQKVRFVEDKTFTVLKAKGAPQLNECQLFGRHVWGDRFDRRVIVTEGELDALSVAQALDFKSAAVVSVNGGASSAAKCLKSNYLWLDRFEDIVLWFDDDKPGQDAAEECAKLFKVGKVRIAKAGEGYKDASALLSKNLPGDIVAAIYKAQAWRPRGIINAADTPEDVLAPKINDAHAWSYPWPWNAMNDKVGPMLPGQVIYHVAGTGVGKTTAIAEIEHHLMKLGCKLGHMGFEDTRRDVKLRLMGIEVSDRLDLEPRPDPEMAALHDLLFKQRAIELFDPETAEWEVDSILGYVRYLAKALDCRIIFLDPLSFIVAGMPGDMDERRALDRVSRDLAALAKELAICLHVSHHLTRPEGTGHEEGAQTSIKEVRGSGGIANFASVIWGHERNQQSPGDGFLITQLRCLKNRPRSVTGVAGCLRYDLRTGRLTPTNEKFPGPTNKQGRNAPPQTFDAIEY